MSDFERAQPRAAGALGDVGRSRSAYGRHDGECERYHGLGGARRAYNRLRRQGTMTLGEIQFGMKREEPRQSVSLGSDQHDGDAEFVATSRLT